MVLGAIFEFIGAALFSSQVAGTLADQFIIGLIDVRVKDQITMMVGTSFSSVLFIMSSSIFGLPNSGTHTIVGAFIGAGIAALGQQSINWKKLGTVVLSWFVSPLFSGLVSFILFTFICLLTLQQSDPGSTVKCVNRVNFKLRNLTLIAATTTMCFNYLLFGLLTRGTPTIAASSDIESQEKKVFFANSTTTATNAT